MITLALLLAGSADAGELPRYDGRFKGDPELSVGEVALLDDAQLRLLRNEVFAQYGRAFSSDDLKAHFAKQAWYVPDSDFDDAVLTEHDRANVALLKSLEGDKKGSVTGEYVGHGLTLALMSDGHCTSAELSDDLYGSEVNDCLWTSRGDWAVIYASGTWPAVSGDVEAIRIDPASKRIVQRERVAPRRG